MARGDLNNATYQYENVKRWLLDGLTTTTFWSKYSFGYAIQKMCAIYFMVNGNDPYHVLELEEELQKLTNSLRANRLSQKTDF